MESIWHCHANSKLLFILFWHFVYFAIKFQVSAWRSVSIGFLIETNFCHLDSWTAIFCHMDSNKSFCHVDSNKLISHVDSNKLVCRAFPKRLNLSYGFRNENSFIVHVNENSVIVYVNGNSFIEHVNEISTNKLVFKKHEITDFLIYEFNEYNTTKNLLSSLNKTWG